MGQGHTYVGHGTRPSDIGPTSWAQARAQPQKARWPWARARAQWPMTWVLLMSYGLVPCPMAVSYVLWPCPMSYGPVLWLVLALVSMVLALVSLVLALVLDVIPVAMAVARPMAMPVGLWHGQVHVVTGSMQ